MLSIYNLANKFEPRSDEKGGDQDDDYVDDDYNSDSTLESSAKAVNNASFGHSDKEDIFNSSLKNSSVKGIYFSAVCLNN